MGRQLVPSIVGIPEPMEALSVALEVGGQGRCDGKTAGGSCSTKQHELSKSLTRRRIGPSIIAAVPRSVGLQGCFIGCQKPGWQARTAS